MDRPSHAEEIIRKHVNYTLAGTLIPIPILDLTAVTAIQLDMIKQLANLYGQDYAESSGKALVGALTGNIFARIGASFLKSIPGIGTFLGIASLLALSGAATYALGQVFLKHLEEGGTMQNFDAEAYKKYYEERYEEGKAKAKAWKKEADETEAEAEPAAAELVPDGQLLAIRKLKELGELREKGILSKKDYDAMRRKVKAEFDEASGEA